MTWIIIVIMLISSLEIQGREKQGGDVPEIYESLEDVQTREYENREIDGDVGCTDNHFQCKDGKCIDIEAKCDREYDCIDESDEHNCVCNNTIEWRCALGDCIPIALRCDGEPDCKDESDEICPCRIGTQFACEDQKGCVDNDRKCDGYPDCGDGSDETRCIKDEIFMKGLDSKPNEVQFRLVCDRNKDCYKANASKMSISKGFLFILNLMLLDHLYMNKEI